MSLSLEKIERLAPDQASLSAAKKLLRPAGWPTLEEDGAGLIWGECQGSGATPYRIAVTEADVGYKCTCPSRKFPCKHSLALMWMRADGNVTFNRGTPPQWVNDWLGRRRGPAVGKPQVDNAAETARPSIAALATEEAQEANDPAALARAEAQRARNREKREELVAAGIGAMDQWIADQLERGLAGFDQRAAQDCATLAKRLVDAKAGGLANRIAMLPAQLFGLDEQHRPLAAARALSAAYLIGQAYTRQDSLPDLLRSDVRQMMGWSVTREALLDDPAAKKMAGVWRVLAARDEVQPDRLRRIETWLECQGDDPVHAVLIDYIPVGGGASGNMYMPGELLDAELAFYPSPVPLRAQIAAHRGTRLADEHWQCVNRPLPSAIAAWRRALSDKPWLGDYPLAASDVSVRSAGEALYAVSSEIALPIAAASAEAAWPLCEAGELALFGLWDGSALTPLLAQTRLGEWVAP